ncbi:hypothetical protein DC852_26620 [Vibrio parahaemolyticus]|nr:hypothetical protein [Vibrio parahaemolyticus]EGQ8942702.1 hypothetical protein [Vibrio parahaemolyticus]EGQ8952475.1 hypothetical protein [Vibrio parahaemolyticus]EGR2715060.1 hypothetical protein [Vibrio parahaemolyticus]EGR2993411.1 hypothetical protein [Vibrio parahaemolyticus]
MKMALGNHPEIEITREKYNDLSTAWEILKAALAIEEKYELVISNFLELEKDSLAISAEHMIRNNLDYSTFFDISSTFNRRIVNLMTATRLYIDQIQQHVKVCDPELVEIVKGSFSLEYDALFEYRFMEALRNYVQHRGLAVHLTQMPSEWVEDGEFRFLEYKTKIYAQRANLEGDKAFKKAVFHEMPERVELLAASKVYMEAISKVHDFIRTSIKEVVDKSREQVKESIVQYASLNNGNAVGLYAISFEKGKSADKIHEKVLLQLSWDDVRLELVRKNGSLNNLSKWYVSGKCI